MKEVALEQMRKYEDGNRSTCKVFHQNNKIVGKCQNTLLYIFIKSNIRNTKLYTKIYTKFYVVIHIVMSGNTHDINYHVYCHVKFDANFDT